MMGKKVQDKTAYLLPLDMKYVLLLSWCTDTNKQMDKRLLEQY